MNIHERFGFFVLTFIFLVVSQSAMAIAAEANRAGWLNAADFGASGSEFETAARTVAGSKQIIVADAGDFMPGQGVMLTGGHVRHSTPRLWSGGPAYENLKPLNNSVEVRGYDGGKDGWAVFLLDIAPAANPTFRWSDDLGRTWHDNVPITHDWQPLSAGVEVRLNQRDWNAGYVISFSARDQLVSTIEKVEGNTITLRDAPNRTSDKARLRHCDDRALEAAVNEAIQQKRNLLIPAGRYRLAGRVMVRDAASITIEGSGATETVLDISQGEGPCLVLSGGTEVTIRNLSMVGFMGFAERDQAGNIPVRGAAPSSIWGFFLKLCNGVTIGGTERVLVENCHASRMSGECFVSASPGRGVNPPATPAGTGPFFGDKTFSANKPRPENMDLSPSAAPDADYSLVWKVNPHGTNTKQTTYLRCSVTDSARNAFNDVTCGPENTSVLFCRIVDVGGCTWEGASRFVRFIGNYVRNSGTVAIGNIGPPNRDSSFENLGSGQHVVAGNVFEGGVCYGGCAIRASAGATQVLVQNNIFVNFNSSGVEMLSQTGKDHFPTANTAVLGNSFDLTAVGQKPIARTAVKISASDSIVADNQIFVRGKADGLATGIQLNEPAMNVVVHDNIVRNCGTGFIAGRVASGVGEVVDQTTFIRGGNGRQIALPLVRDDSHGYRGWNLVWIRDGKPDGVSIIESFDRKTRRFKLREPRAMRPGDQFEVFSPDGPNWLIHHNQITDCQRPVVLDSYGGATAIFRDNQLSRGRIEGVKQAVEIRGQWKLIGNCLCDFNETDSAAMSLYLDRLGNPPANLYQNNVFERCNRTVRENQAALWQAATIAGNQFIHCGDEPPTRQ
jgi:hypothetical protein